MYSQSNSRTVPPACIFQTRHFFSRDTGKYFMSLNTAYT